MNFDPTTAVPAGPQFNPLRAVPLTGPTTRQILTATSTITPDQATEAERLAKRFGTSSQAVLGDIETFRRQAQVDQADAALSRSPVLTDVVRQDPFKAPQVRDDLVPLSTLAEMVESFKRGLAATRRGSDVGSIVDSVEVLSLISRIERGELPTDLEITKASRYGSMFVGAAKTPENLARMRQFHLQRISENVIDFGRRTQEIEASPPSPELAKFQQQTGFGEALSALGDAPVRITAQVVTESLGALLPALPIIAAGGIAGGPFGLAMTTGMSSASIEYLNELPNIFRELKVDINDIPGLQRAIRTPEFLEKNRQAMIKAGVIGVFDAATAGLVGVRLATRPAANVAAQVGVQMVGGGAGEAAGSIASGQEVSAAAVISEMIGEIPGAVIDLGTMALRRASEMAGQAQEATTAADTLQTALQTAAESKLRQRSPEDFRAVLEQMARTEDGRATEIYVDGEVLNQLPIEVRSLLPQVVQDQIPQAAGIGDVVAIPVADALTVAPGTPLEQVLVENARLRPDAMTQSEARAAGDQAAQYLQQEYEKVVQQAQDQEAFRASTEAVRASVVAELNAAGRHRPQVNEAMSHWMSSFFATQAFYEGVTPEQLYNEMRVRMLGEAPAGQGGVLNAGERGDVNNMTAAQIQAEITDLMPRVQQAYEAGNAPLAERLDARLETLMDALDANLAELEEDTLTPADLLNPILAARIQEGELGDAEADVVRDLANRWRDMQGRQGDTLAEQAAELRALLDDYAFRHGGLREGLTDAEVLDAARDAYDSVYGRLERQRERMRAQAGTLEQKAKEPDSNVKLPKKVTATTAIDLRNGPRLTGNQRMSIHQVAAFFDKITGKRDFNDPKEQKRAIKQIVAELRYQLQREQSGLDWYEGDIKLAFETTARVIPSLAENVTKRQLFAVVAGLQSPGTLADMNWDVAAQTFQHYENTGQIPGRNPANGNLWAGGPVSANKEKALEFLNAMVQDLGEQRTVEWLYSEHTVKELNEARRKWGNMGPGVDGKASDLKLGMFAFGPKVGPFVMNINGIPELTVDLWATRSFNRYFGQMTGPDGKIVDAPTEPQRRVVKELFNAAAEQVGIKPYQVQSVLWFFEQQLFNHLGTGSASLSFSDGARKFAERSLPSPGRDGSAATFQQGGLTDGRDQQAGDGRGRYSGGGLAALEGAPNVAGASGPDPRIVAVAEQYALDNGIPLRRQGEYAQVDPDRAGRIAAAYDAMVHAPQDPAVREAYENLIRQTLAQYRALEAAGYRFYLVDESNDPYGGNPWNAMRDLRANQTMGVFATEAGFGSGATELNVEDNPLLADTGLRWPYGSPDGELKRVLANDLFRAVHDAFGHGLEGAGFRAQGEENAWQAHIRLFTGSARGAITSETRGQNSWLNFGPYGESNRTAKVEDTVFADQKTGLMPEWTWAEGIVPDLQSGETDGTLEQTATGPFGVGGVQRLRAGDLDVVAEYGTGIDGSVSVTGVHYSASPRATLAGHYYGRGLKGAEAGRLADADPRLSNRIHFYVDTGQGIGPEAGVGGYVHAVQLNNLYDTSADPLGFVAAARAVSSGVDGSWFNSVEQAVIDAGFDGVYVPAAQGSQGVAVLLGPQHAQVPVDQRGTHAMAGAGAAIPQPTGKLRYSLMSAEIRRFEENRAEILASAPSLQLRNGTLIFDEADAAAVAAVFPGAANARPLAQGPRGTFNPRTLELVLSPTADLSTFFHESGHFFLEALVALASRPNAPVRTVEMVDQTMRWFGIAGDTPETRRATWQGMSLDQQRPYHERWAESIEQYVMEGKAPSVELQPLMRRFRAWFLNAYKSIKQFLANKPDAERQPLNDDIRRVMDRMLATDEQIAQANEVAGLVPDEQADGEAAERLQKRSMADLKWAVKARDKVIKALQKQAKEIERSVRMEVTAEVNAMPEVLAAEAIRKAEKDYEGDPVSADMNIATIADAYGYASVDAMYQAIEAFGDKREAIDGLTERRLLENYGELIDERSIIEAANEAVHNEARARSLATELRTQQEMLGQRRDTGETTASGARRTVNVLVEAAKQFGANVVARTPLKDLRATAWKHTAAERRAGKRWQEATAAGNTADAVKAKQDQVLNNAAAKAALDAADQAKKILEFFGRVTKGNDEKVVEKGRDPDIVNAARAVLAAYGIQTPASKNAAAYMETVKKNDPETYGAIEPMISAAMVNAQPLEALTFEELQGLHESIQAFWFMSKRSRQMEIDGNLLDIDDVAQELNLRMEAIGIPDRVPGEGMAVTKEEERGLFLKQGVAFLRRVEQWAEGMDGKYGGPFLRYVFQPIKDAADAYRKDRIAYRKRFQALVDNLAPIVGDSVIAAPELGYTFGTPGSTAGTAMNEILHAIAHTGNDSNKRKLLLGRGWATENADGTLDTGRWDAFIARLVAEGKLTQGHFDFVQGVWDLLEDTKPLAQKAHRDAFGRYFSEVTANEFVDPFGVTRRGGYLPAQVDTRLVKDNVLRKMAEEQNNSMAYSFPQPAKGFTMARTEYNQPLMLDLRSLSQHIDKVLLFGHMTNPARDVRKLITRKTVSQPLDRIQPATIESMLQPWLQRSAQQIVETPIVGSGKWARIPGLVRSRAGAALMFANVSNSVQQISGLATASIRVKPSYLMRSMAQYVANPLKFSRAVWEASPYMDDRAKNEVAVLNEQMQAILIKPTVYETMRDWGMRHAYFLQTAVDNVLSPIVWTGAFNQALADGMSDADAVRFADATVRQTQGSTLPEDVSRLETGPAYARAFTQFVGYFNMLANTNATALKQIVGEVGLKKGAGRALYVVMMGLMSSLWIAEAIAIAFKGGPEDEDEDGYLDDWLAQVFGMGTVKGLLAQIPIVGQFGVAAFNRFNDNPLDDRVSLSPAISLLESAVGAPESVYKAIVEDGSAQKAIRDVATLVSVATGVPVYGLARPIGYAAGVAQGRIEPEGPVDLARGLITGTASPESKQR